MFSQFNDRLSSLEAIVASLHANILELKEENTKLKEQIASLSPKPLEDEPAVVAPESFMFKPALSKPTEDELVPKHGELPKAVPRHSKFSYSFKKLVETDVYSRVEDPRWIFLNADENRDKYYYVRHGSPNRILPFEGC